MKYLAAVLLFSAPLAWGNIVIVNNDGAGEGFNDTTPVTAIGGNPGTTLGQQRLNVFQQAADILNQRLQIDVVVRVAATFDPLFCTSGSGVLGQAGPEVVEFDYNTRSITPHALFNQQNGADADPNYVEISAQFNSNIDNNDNCLFNTNWHYGYDAPSGNDNSLLSVVMHELIHGMGFLSYLQSNGESSAGWSSFSGFEEAFDPYTRQLKDAASGQLLTNLSSGSRASVMQSTSNLVWNGSEANALAANYSTGTTSNQIRMYAPSSYEPGSSVSHFDEALSPDELMKPTYTSFIATPGLSEQALVDIGWQYNEALVPNNPPSLSAVGSQSLAEDTSSTITLSASDADNDPLTYQLDSADAVLNAQVTGDQLTLTPEPNYHGSSTVTVSVSDGTDSDQTSFTVTVTPVNDAPVLTPIGSQSMNEDGVLSLSLSATDVDQDALVFSLDASSDALGTQFSGTQLTLRPIPNFNGSGTFTVSVSDGTVTDTETVTVTVNNVNDAPVLSAINNQTLPWDSTLDITLVASDLDGDPLTFSASSADTSVVTVEVTGDQLTLTPATTNAANTLVTAVVSDGAITSTVQFNVTLSDPEVYDPLTLAIGNVLLNDGDLFPGPLDDIPLLPAGGDGAYTLTVYYNGMQRPDLLLNSQLVMPDSGAFAGRYRLDLSDGDGGSAVFYIDRPLRLSTDIDPLLENTQSAQVFIEGAPAGAWVTLSADTSLSFVDDIGNALTETQANADPSTFHLASAYLKTPLSVGTGNVQASDITAQVSNVPDSVLSIDTVARRWVSLTIRDEFMMPIPDALLTLTDSRRLPWGLDTEYRSNADGNITLSLPELTTDILITVEGYDTLAMTLDSDVTELDVRLEGAEFEYRISGTIFATGFTFDNELPSLSIGLNDGQRIEPMIRRLSNTRVAYEWGYSFQTAVPETLTVEHSAVPPITIGLNAAFQQEALDVQLVSLSNNTDDDTAAGAMMGLPAGSDHTEPASYLTYLLWGLMLSLLYRGWGRGRKPEQVLSRQPKLADSSPE